MAAYYNENNLKCSAALRYLAQANVIKPGVIDNRSILDVKAKDLIHYEQCHFFAGIGGWSIALRMANWPNIPVWTGSCPCQPFSRAGKRKGVKDERHLWPIWYDLIKKCLPPIIFGEQVASKGGLAWFDIVSTNLEDEGYAIAAVDICAASIGAPHKRSRLWFIAERMDNSLCKRLEGQYKYQLLDKAKKIRLPSTPNSWYNCDWLKCRDGKLRPTKSGLHPVAYGVPRYSSEIAAYGNAIVPQVAALFISCYIDLLNQELPPNATDL